MANPGVVNFDESRVDLILFPELASTGYIRPVNTEFGREFRKCAEPIPGYTTNMLGKLSEKYHVHIVAGVAELGNDRLLEARSNPTVFRDRRPELYGMLSQPY